MSHTQIRLGQVAVSWLLAFAVNAGESHPPFINSLQQLYVYIPAGDFTMGTEDLDALAFELPSGDFSQVKDETPSHVVSITSAFYMANTEVTQGQWFELMGTRPGPTENWQHPDWARLPVVSVTWFMAKNFIKRLNEREPARHYRLPTEAEWEYSARAGTRGIRSFPVEELALHAWFIESSGDSPQPVAYLLPNAWGLFDVYGNAWEWVADRYQPDYYAGSVRLDPQGPTVGAKRVRRGGSYHCKSHMVRPGYRAADAPDKRYSVLGFRVLLELTSSK